MTDRYLNFPHHDRLRSVEFIRTLHVGQKIKPKRHDEALTVATLFAQGHIAISYEESPWAHEYPLPEQFENPTPATSSGGVSPFISSLSQDQLRIHEALCDSSYIAGANAAWNATCEADVDDARAKFDALIKSREGHLEGYAVAKANLAAAAIGSPSSRTGWSHISEAPRDGRDILAADRRVSGGFMSVVYYDPVHGNEWVWHTKDGVSYHEDAFTDWQPLPTQPALSTAETEER